jgi:hypothetical protein
MLPAKVYWLDHIHLKSLHRTQAAERFDIATSSPAESVIVSDHELSHGAALEQNLPHEAFGREPRQVAIEAKQEHVIKRRLGQNFQPLSSSRQ